MVVTSFEIRVGSEESIASICIPFASILPVLEKPTEDVQLTPEERMSLLRAQSNLTAGLSLAPLDVAVRFQPIRMRTDDIIDLRPGDVVPLGHPITVPLSVVVNDTVFAHAVPGTQGARLACLIVPSPKEDSRK